MGISARFIRQSDTERHIITEANRAVAGKARRFAASAAHPVSVLEGLWEDRTGEIPDGSLGGILFDSHPLGEEELQQNHFPFLPHAFKKLRAGGVLTCYPDEARAFSKVHMKRLIAAGSKADLHGGAP